MNLNEKYNINNIITLFVKAIVVCALIHVSIIFTLMNKPRMNDKGLYLDPSPYVNPENSYTHKLTISVSFMQILLHKIRSWFSTVQYNIFGEKQLYNTWNSMTQQEYLKPSHYIVTKTEFPFLIKGESICPKEKFDPVAVVMIHSYWKDVEQRNAIRNTWASGRYNCALFNKEKARKKLDENKDRLIDFGSDENAKIWRHFVRHIFIFGLPEFIGERHEALALLRNESILYNDIVVADFHDTYRNLTTKVNQFSQ